MNLNLRLLYSFIILKSLIPISADNLQTPRRPGSDRSGATKNGIKRNTRPIVGEDSVLLRKKELHHEGLSSRSPQNGRMHSVAETRRGKIKTPAKVNRLENVEWNNNMNINRENATKVGIRHRKKNALSTHKNMVSRSSISPIKRHNRTINNKFSNRTRSSKVDDSATKRQRKFSRLNKSVDNSASLRNRVKKLAKVGSIKLGKMALNHGLDFAQKILTNDTSNDDSQDDEDYENLFGDETERKKNKKDQKQNVIHKIEDEVEESDEDLTEDQDHYPNEELSSTPPDDEDILDDETDDDYEALTNNDDDAEENDEGEDNFDLADDEPDFQDYGIVGHNYKTPSGLEYLGAGYDLIKGNPLGDQSTLLDPGYRSNIIQMHWSKRFEGVSNSLKFLQPLGGWIRPYPSCHKVEAVTEIQSSDSFLKALSTDANVSLTLPGDSLKFSASAKFKQLEDASKSESKKIYINRSYCFKYVTGISTSLHWDFTLGFKSALSTLSPHFKGLYENSGCKPFVYLEDPTNEACISLGVTSWMEFFETFGTHVTTKIYLGGKIFSIIEISNNQEKKFKNLGIDVKAILTAQLENSGIDSNVKVSVLKSKNNEEYLLDAKKTTLVVGGDIYNYGKYMSFNKWSETVSDYAMPIKAEYTPIIKFLDESMTKAYNDAYIYYGKLLLSSDG